MFLTLSYEVTIIYLRLFPSSRTMPSNSSTTRNRLQATCIQVWDSVKECDYKVPGMERACWKITNPGRRFWNCRNSLVSLDHPDNATFVKARIFYGLNVIFHCENPCISKKTLTLGFQCRISLLMIDIHLLKQENVDAFVNPFKRSWFH